MGHTFLFLCTPCGIFVENLLVDYYNPVTREIRFSPSFSRVCCFLIVEGCTCIFEWLLQTILQKDYSLSCITTAVSCYVSLCSDNILIEISLNTRTIFKLLFSWFSVCLVAINLCLLSRVLTVLALTVSVCFSDVFVEGWGFGGCLCHHFALVSPNLIASI